MISVSILPTAGARPSSYVSTSDEDASTFGVLHLDPDPAQTGQHATLNLGGLGLDAQVDYLHHLATEARLLAAHLAAATSLMQRPDVLPCADLHDSDMSTRHGVSDTADVLLDGGKP